MDVVVPEWARSITVDHDGEVTAWSDTAEPRCFDGFWLMTGKQEGLCFVCANIAPPEDPAAELYDIEYGYWHKGLPGDGYSRREEIKHVELEPGRWVPLHPEARWLTQDADGRWDQWTKRPYIIQGRWDLAIEDTGKLLTDMEYHLGDAHPDDSHERIWEIER